MGRAYSEATVLNHCIQSLTLLQIRKELIFKRISTTGIPIANRGPIRFKKNPAKGMADIMVFLSHNGLPYTLHFELKSETGKQTDEQKAFQAQLISVGHHTYHVIRSLQDMLAVLKCYGIVL